MPNNDSIDRNVVLNHLGDLFTLCRETGSITEKDLESFEKIIKSLSPVATEMTAREYAMTKGELCSKQVYCSRCDFAKVRCACYILERDYPDEAIAIVKAWAKEHEERNDDNNAN